MARETHLDNMYNALEDIVAPAGKTGIGCADVRTNACIKGAALQHFFVQLRELELCAGSNYPGDVEQFMSALLKYQDIDTWARIRYQNDPREMPLKYSCMSRCKCVPDDIRSRARKIVDKERESLVGLCLACVQETQVSGDTLRFDMGNCHAPTYKEHETNMWVLDKVIQYNYC